MKDLELMTGVSRETIRFYIRQGLLPEPERPARNVAWYDDAFVERLRLIKALQAKRFLPLNVIKSLLAGADVPPMDHVKALTDLDGKVFSDRTQPERLSAVAKRAGLPAREVRELAAIGVVELELRDGGQWMDADSIRIVEQWATMRQAGFTDARGFATSVLGLHMDFVEWLAREELRLFSRGITGQVNADEAARMAEVGIECINEMLTALRRRTLLKYITAGNVPDDTSDAYPASRPKAS